MQSNFEYQAKLHQQMNIPKKLLSRQYEITADFFKELDIHLADITAGRTNEMFEIKQFAAIMHIHPTHLTNTVKLTTGKPPCYFYEDKILQIAKSFLESNATSIAAIAISLTYDPSNFTKFFKRFTGQTPKQYREDFLYKQTIKQSELLTI